MRHRVANRTRIINFLSLWAAKEKNLFRPRGVGGMGSRGGSGAGNDKDFSKLTPEEKLEVGLRQMMTGAGAFARLLKTADRALADKKSWNLQVVFEKWFHLYQHDLNKLSPAKDKETRLLEFLAATSECELGYGESPLSRAAAQVAKRPPPPELKKFDNENLRKLACFCRGLAEQDQFGEMRFFLDARSAAKVVGKSDGMTGLRLMNALCALQVLKITKRGTRGKNGKSTRYQYIASDANEEVDNES